MILFLRSTAVFFALFNTLYTQLPVGPGGSTTSVKGYQMQLWYLNANNNDNLFLFNVDSDTLQYSDVEYYFETEDISMSSLFKYSNTHIYNPSAQAYFDKEAFQFTLGLRCYYADTQTYNQLYQTRLVIGANDLGTSQEQREYEFNTYYFTPSNFYFDFSLGIYDSDNDLVGYIGFDDTTFDLTEDYFDEGNLDTYYGNRNSNTGKFFTKDITDCYYIDSNDVQHNVTSGNYLDFFNWIYNLDSNYRVRYSVTFNYYELRTDKILEYIDTYHTPDDYATGYGDGYADGQRDGYEWGKNDGQRTGYEIGYRTAYDEYYNSRYQQGLNDGYTQASTNPYTFARLFGAIADTPIMIIRNLLGFDVFGVSAMTILMSMITGCIAIFLIRKFIF